MSSSFRRLLKSRSERYNLESELKDLQDSLLGLKKKQVPTSDLAEEVIHVSVARQNTDYACCVGETQRLIASVLLYFYNCQIGVFFLQKALVISLIFQQMHSGVPHTH